MTSEEKLIDEYVTETHVMLNHLADNLITLDELRESHKQASLEHFGLAGDPLKFDHNLQKLIASHLERYDKHMGSYLTYAHVVLAYMFFEDRLYAFGETFSGAQRGPAFVPDKKNGSLLDKFERYLNGIKIEAPKKELLEPLLLIRNCIVHYRGCVLDYDESKSDMRMSLKQYLPNLVGVTTDTRDYLVLTTEGCLMLQERIFQYVCALNSTAGFRLWRPPEVRRMLFSP